MFLGIEDGSGVPGTVEIGIYSVVSLGFTGLFDLLVPGNGISSAVSYMFPSLFSFGSFIYAPNSLILKW